MAVDKELKDRLDAIINGLNSLTGKKSGMSSQQGNATNTSSVKNSFNSDYSADRLQDYQQRISEINRETKQIQENIFSYETAYKRLTRLDEERVKLEKELTKGGLTELQRAQKILQYNQKLNEIEKERAKLQSEGYTRLDDVNSKLEKRTTAIKKATGEIKKGFEDITRSVKGIVEPWGKISQAAANYAKSIGMSGRGMENLRKSTLNIYNTGKIGTNFNVSMEEFLKLRQDFVNGIGRNVTVGSKGLGDLAAMSKILGEQGATEFASKLENFGLSLAESGDRAGKLFAKASKFGISAEKMSKNFLTNISKAQDYTFAKGLRGLENMAKRATELKLDMGQAFAFADKVSTVEGAITTAANLQVLGGPFTQYSDAIQMLQEGLTDPEALQERMIKMFGSMGHFNRQTGEVEVSASNRQRIKAAAQAAGLDYSNVMEMVFSNARGGEIARQVGGRGLFANQDYLNLLKNVGTFENGVAGAYVTRNGKQEFVKAQEMTENDMKELVTMSKSESDNIQDIAKTLRGWDDVISGTKKQIEGAKAQAVETTGIGKKVQNIVNIVGQSNAILKTIAIASITAGVMGAAGGLWGMVRGGARLGPGIGNLFRRTASSRIPGGGAQTIGLGYGPGGGIVGMAPNGTPATPTRAPFNPTQPSPTTTQVVRGRNMAGLGAKITAQSLGRAALTGGIGGGVLSGLFTGINEFSGNNNHSTLRKIGRTGGSALGGFLGGTVGALTGPLAPVLIPLLSMAGAELGKIALGGNDYRRNKKKQEWGLDYLSGDYSVRELRKIKEGKVSGKLQREMEKNGDATKEEKIMTDNHDNMRRTADSVEDISNFLMNRGNTGMARGGQIGGPGGIDNVPIWASRGEFIMSNKAVNMWGADRLSAMNNFANTNNGKYANGGIIKPWRGYNTGSSTNNVTFKAPSTTSFADKLKVEPIKIDVSGTIKIDCGNMLKEIDASKIITDEFIRKQLAPKIEASIRQRWNAANTNVRGGDTISI